jgi:iron complex outermembrane receptor protein
MFKAERLVRSRQRSLRLLAGSAVLGLVLEPSAAVAQARDRPQTEQREPDDIRFSLPTVTVTAEKVPEDVQNAPESVTAVSKELLNSAGARYVGDAAIFAPNTMITDWSARKLSNATFRGIGSSPNNPGVTTYIDGVPQLNANSASIELIDVDQIEFVRGPQSALYGRNTLGGLISLVSTPPSLKKWVGSVTGILGDFHSGDMRATASGPLVADTLAVGFALGYSGRDGFTTNDLTAQHLDSRSAFFGKGQLLWTPNAAWQARVILTGERARDGDYALGDLAGLRTDPFHVSRYFVGFTNRDIVAPTVVVTHTSGSLDISNVAGFVWWKTEDLTDLDYTAPLLITRDNNERDLQFTEELRVAPTKNAVIRLSDHTSFRWQAGLFVFTQHYTQDAVNDFAPFVLSPSLGFSVSQTSPRSALDDRGIGAYGQGTVTFRDRFDGTVGIRVDRENKQAGLNTFYSPAIAAPSAVNAEKSFADVSPQFTGAYRLSPGKLAYVTAAQGYKAGGFNAASPPGSEAYGEERSWNYEAGVKTSWLSNRLSVDGSAFVIDWQDLQLNVPNPQVPAQYYIANVGGARSKGVELSLLARPIRSLDVFGAVGYTNAHFSNGTQSSGIAVGGNRLPATPVYTATVGTQYSVEAYRAASLYGRFDIAFTGSYEYDDFNTAGQDAYSLANLRGGIRGRRAFIEGWVRNLFDTRYIPIAFAYPGLAPSGFVGEMGAPRTFGLRAGFIF